MFSSNSGYKGNSRSIRSQAAIDNFEMPIAQITADKISSFLKLYADDFKPGELEILRPLTAAKWKFAANRMPASSWHHTSAKFNCTNHYSLLSVAEKILSYDDFNAFYDKEKAAEKAKKEAAKMNYSYGVAEVQIWGGTSRRPKIEGYEKMAGIIIGNWLYYKAYMNKNRFTNKINITANKTEWVERFGSYAELVKKYPEYKNTSATFNAIIKEKI